MSDKLSDIRRTYDLINNTFYVQKGERGLHVAIETAEAWTRGEAMIEQVKVVAAAVEVACVAFCVACVVDASAHAVAFATALKTMADAVRGIITVDMLEGKRAISRRRINY